MTAVIGWRYLLQMVSTAISGGRKVVGAVAAERAVDLLWLKRLAEQERIKPFIDRCCCRLEEIIEAHRYAEKGHKRGNVIIVPGAKSA